MNVLSILTEFFLNAFQITRPAPHQQRRAELIIGGAVLLTLFMVAVALIGLLIWVFHA